MKFHSERHAFPIRETPSRQRNDSLRRRDVEEGGEGIRHAEQLDDGSTGGRSTGIAPEPLCPREPIMRPLRPRKDRRLRGWTRGSSLREHHFDALATEELHTGALMLSAAPIARSRRGEQPTWSLWKRRLTRRGFFSLFI